jgi:hypothetical protein
MEEESICKDVPGTFVSIEDKSLVYTKDPRKKIFLAMRPLGQVTGGPAEILASSPASRVGEGAEHP